MLATVRAATLMGLGFGCIAGGGAARAEPLLEVDLQLVLAVDVSHSMDGEEHRIQRDGYVAAFRHPDIVRAIESGPLGRIAVAYFEWAGPRHQSVAVPWTVLAGREDANAFADALAAQPIMPEAGTSISAALQFAERIFAVGGATGLRRAVDVSGDGPNNAGPPLAPMRDRLVGAGITINGLPIAVAAPRRSDVAAYYERWVVGGPGAFTVAVGEISSLAEAILRKLVREIAAREPAPEPPAGSRLAWSGGGQTADW
jgi:hypothetical protein